MRQFDWIRGCALHKLGRSDEARRVVSGIFSSPRPASKDFFVPAGATLEARYRWCVGDLDWLNGQFRRDLEQPLAPAGAVSILYGKAPPFPQHQQMVNAIWSQLRDPNTMGRLREPPPGWRDLLDSGKLAVRARAIIASAPR